MILSCDVCVRRNYYYLYNTVGPMFFGYVYSFVEIFLTSSFSPLSHSHSYVGSMYDDILLHVAWSYTSSAGSPFSNVNVTQT